MHGYLSTFPEAVETTARLDTALKFRGPVLLFSWPSQKMAPTRAFEQVVFFAPDVNRTTLELQAQMQNLRSTAARMTIYGSSHDCALQAAELVSDVPRAGRVPGSAGILVVPPAESVDVSAAVAADDVLGHSDYGSARVADDLAKVIAGVAPVQRLLDLSNTTPPYWVLKA